MSRKIEITPEFDQQVDEYMIRLLSYGNYAFADKLQDMINKTIESIRSSPYTGGEYLSFIKTHKYNYRKKLFGDNNNYTIFYTVEPDNTIIIRYFFYRGFSEDLLENQQILPELITL